MTHHDAGRYPEALASFETALAARERIGDPGRTRVARWMVAWTLRSLGRHDEALAILRRLEAENEAAGTPDGYVFEELAENLLVQGRGDAARPYFARAWQLLSADTSLDRPSAEHLARLDRLSR
jgi:tetratricopeptide (TPR) repeat protein